jgi:hypothetical protein
MPRKKAEPKYTAAEWRELDAMTARTISVAHALEHLSARIAGREAEVTRARRMVLAALDGMPLTIQYAAIIGLGSHCLTEMGRDPEACPHD